MRTRTDLASLSFARSPRYSLEWLVRTEPNVDADGWEYAGTDWDRTMVSFTPKYNRLFHFTRRRVLTRRCRKAEESLWPRAMAGAYVSSFPYLFFFSLHCTCSF